MQGRAGHASKLETMQTLRPGRSAGRGPGGGTCRPPERRVLITDLYKTHFFFFKGKAYTSNDKDYMGMAMVPTSRGRGKTVSLRESPDHGLAQGRFCTVARLSTGP